MNGPGKPVPNWDQLGFSLVETDSIWCASGDRRQDPAWLRGGLRAFANLSVSPGAAFLSYGQGVFEGLKARRSEDGRLLLFRPEANARRFQRSAERLALLPFPEGEFLRAVTETVQANERFVPPAGKGSIYVRPVEVAVEPRLGLGLCDRFQVIVYGSPVGSYFASGRQEGLRLKVLRQGRCAPGGTGAAKAMGNYAGTLPIAAHWKEHGFDDVLFLDARDVRHVTETCGSNVFCALRSGTLVTPPLDDQILPGVTRDSVLRIAREVLKLSVEERPLPIEEVVDQGAELLCTGTAWTLQSVAEIEVDGKTHRFERATTRSTLFEILDGIQNGRREDPFDWTREV